MFRSIRATTGRPATGRPVVSTMAPESVVVAGVQAEVDGADVGGADRNGLAPLAGADIPLQAGVQGGIGVDDEVDVPLPGGNLQGVAAVGSGDCLGVVGPVGLARLDQNPPDARAADAVGDLAAELVAGKARGESVRSTLPRLWPAVTVTLWAALRSETLPPVRSAGKMR